MCVCVRVCGGGRACVCRVFVFFKWFFVTKGVLRKIALELFPNSLIDKAIKAIKSRYVPRLIAENNS